MPAATRYSVLVWKLNILYVDFLVSRYGQKKLLQPVGIMLFCVWRPYRHECNSTGVVWRIDNGLDDDDVDDASDDVESCNLLMVFVS